MGYISLYRKYRSQTFDEIVGQEAIVTTLKNAISGGRLGHSYLFTGPRGTGKTSTARIFAKALNCTGGTSPNPCGKCEQCVKITSGQALNVIEIDAASNRGIDEIRDLREKVRYKPVEGKYKVYIIDEVHMLTPEAFNALLKTLEEPPADTVFILATTEPQKVPVTISSRCQRFDFGRISFARISEHLKKIAGEEGFSIGDDAIKMIARSSEGSLRDALSLMDQLVSFCQGEIKIENVVDVLGTAEPEFLFDMGEAVLNGDEKAIMDLVQKAVSQGVSVPQLAKDLVYHFRNLMLARVGSTDLLELSGEQVKRLEEDSASFSLDWLKDILRALSAAETDMKWHQNSRLVLEVALLEICRRDGDRPAKSGGTKEVVVSKPAPTEQKNTVLMNASPGRSVMDKLMASWDEILQKVKSKSLFGFVSLSEAVPSSIDPAGRLVLSFRKGYSFHKARVEESQNKAVLEDSIRDATGEKLSVLCVISEGDEKPSKAAEASVSVDDIVEMFDGKIM